MRAKCGYLSQNAPIQQAEKPNVTITHFFQEDSDVDEEGQFIKKIPSDSGNISTPNNVHIINDHINTDQPDQCIDRKQTNNVVIGILDNSNEDVASKIAPQIDGETEDKAECAYDKIMNDKATSNIVVEHLPIHLCVERSISNINTIHDEVDRKHLFLNSRKIEILGKFVLWNFRLRSMCIMKALMPIFSIIHWFAKRHVSFALGPIFLYSSPENYVLAILLGFIPLFITSHCSLLKDALMIPRPKWLIKMPETLDVSEWAVEKSFSTPSNHSSIFASVGTVSMLYFNYSWSSILMTFCLVLFTMVSRMYLMVHYAHDVLIGAVIGILLSFPLYHLGLIQSFIGSNNNWSLTWIWTVGWISLNTFYCIIHRYFIESQLPSNKILQIFMRNNGASNTDINFLRFTKTSWYYVIYIAVAALSIDILCNVSGFDVDDGILISPNNNKVDLSTVGWIGTIIIIVLLKLMENIEKNSKLFAVQRNKFYFRIFVYAVISFFNFYLMPIYFIKVVSVNISH
eukprot:422401_1